MFHDPDDDEGGYGLAEADFLGVDTDGVRAGEYGACCACGKEDSTVRNLMMLEVQAPVPGTGWGCFVCRVPNDGAMAVICDACLEGDKVILYACKGYISRKERVVLNNLTIPFTHTEGVEH